MLYAFCFGYLNNYYYKGNVLQVSQIMFPHHKYLYKVFISVFSIILKILHFEPLNVVACLQNIKSDYYIMCLFVKSLTAMYAVFQLPTKNYKDKLLEISQVLFSHHTYKL